MANWDADEDVRKNSTLLEPLPGVHYLRTPGELRIFFRVDADTVTILYVANVRAIRASGGLPTNEGTRTADLQPSAGL